jgi:hypothetical protein
VQNTGAMDAARSLAETMTSLNMAGLQRNNKSNNTNKKKIHAYRQSL